MRAHVTQSGIVVQKPYPLSVSYSQGMTPNAIVKKALEGIWFDSKQDYSRRADALLRALLRDGSLGSAPAAQER